MERMITLIAKNMEHTFYARTDSTILDEALNKNILFPYACATGTCGNCAFQLISGEVEDPWAEAPGRKSKSDIHLGCQCRAVQNSTIKINTNVFTADQSALPKKMDARIKKITLINPRTCVLTISIHKQFSYIPGQFVLLESNRFDGPRAFSIVSFDRHSSEITFLVRSVKGGAWSNLLFQNCDSLINEKIGVRGPYGRATFSPTMRKKPIFIAGGSGIAGIRAMIERARIENYFSVYPGRLYFGLKHEDDAFWLEYLNSACLESGEKFRVTVTFDDIECLESLSFRFSNLNFQRGLVHQIASQELPEINQDSHIFLAGPPGLITAAMKLLIIKNKVKADSISFDSFG